MPTKKSTTKEKREKLTLIRERMKRVETYDHDNRVEAMEDLKFVNVPGEQWEDFTKTERGDRPCYEFNKIRVTIKRVVNDMRANRPSGKVRGTEEDDVPTAETLEGLIRNIWNVSDADTIIDHAAEYQVGAGMGAWRVNVGYSDDSAFEQDITIENIRNPFCLYADSAAQDPLKRDARYWILATRISKTAYEQRWPKAEVVDFEVDNEFDDDDEDDDWEGEDNVRIVEYWYREPVTKTLLLLEDGKTIDAADEASVAAAAALGVNVIRSREVESSVIKMCIASGSAILEESDWAGKEFPFIMVYGESVVVDGKHRWFGLTRFAKDAQRSYNYSRTLAAETVALAPQAKWWTTAAQAQGQTEKWAEAHRKNYPFLVYNADTQAPGPPSRMEGAQIPMALIQEMQISSDDIKNVTGIFDPALGKQSNETSGVAIRARAEQGEIAVFNYKDNMSKGVLRTWEILIDLIPKIYDTQRAVRILGRDGAEKYARVNQPAPDGSVVNDLSRGKYDVTVTVGPSYSTQRQEAAETYSAFANSNPALFAIIGDLIFKATDLPYAEQIANRLKLLLPPQIQQAEATGKPLPPEVAAAMQQAEQAMQQVQLMSQEIQKAGAEAQSEKADAEKGKSELQVMSANLKVAEANIATDVAKFEKLVVETQMKLSGDKKDLDGREELVGKVEEALQQITVQSQAFMQDAAALLQQMQALTVQPVVLDNPVNRSFRIRRVNGGLEGTVVDSTTGEPLRQVDVQRVGTEMVGTIKQAET